MSNEMYRRGQWDALEKFAAGYNPAQFVPHFKADYAKHLGYGALGGGLANAGIAALRGDDLGDVAASGLRGAALGGLVGTGVGLYRGRNDPARAANHLHYIRHHQDQYSPKTRSTFGQAYYDRHAKDPAALAAMPAPVREEFEGWGRALQAAKDKAAQSKAAADVHDLVTAMSAINPGAGSLAAGMTAPEGHGVGYATRTGLAGIGGRTVGETAGSAIGDILATLLKKDPGLFRRIGERAGATAGGALGGHVGHNWAQQASYS